MEINKTKMAPLVNETIVENTTVYNDTNSNVFENPYVEVGSGFGLFVVVMYICCICVKDKSSGRVFNLFYLCIIHPVSNMYTRICEKINSRRIATRSSDMTTLHIVPLISNNNHHDVLARSVKGQNFVKKISDKGSISGDCPICWHEMHKKNQCPVSLSCDHVFHKKCIVKWLEEFKLECPICRGEPTLLK